MRFHDLEQQKTSLPVANVLAPRCGCSTLGATAPLNLLDEQRLPSVTPNVRAKLGPTVGRQARGADNARLLQPGPGGLPLGLSLSDRLGLRARWWSARISGDNPAQVKRPRDHANRPAAWV